MLLRARNSDVARDLLLKALENVEPVKDTNLSEYIAIKKNLGRAYSNLTVYPLAIEKLKECLTLEK